MGNESGEWIMHGIEWDNPDCLHSVDEAIEYINEVGFLPLFKNDIEGFSIEERTVPEHWWSDNPKIDPWMWRAVIARRRDIVYGKFFDKKAGFGKDGTMQCIHLLSISMDMIMLLLVIKIIRRSYGDRLRIICMNCIQKQRINREVYICQIVIV